MGSWVHHKGPHTTDFQITKKKGEWSCKPLALYTTTKARAEKLRCDHHNLVVSMEFDRGGVESVWSLVLFSRREKRAFNHSLLNHQDFFFLKKRSECVWSEWGIGREENGEVIEWVSVCDWVGVWCKHGQPCLCWCYEMIAKKWFALYN